MTMLGLDKLAATPTARQLWLTFIGVCIIVGLTEVQRRTGLKAEDFAKDVGMNCVTMLGVFKSLEVLFGVKSS